MNKEYCPYCNKLVEYIIIPKIEKHRVKKTFEFYMDDNVPICLECGKEFDDGVCLDETLNNTYEWARFRYLLNVPVEFKKT